MARFTPVIAGRAADRTWRGRLRLKYDGTLAETKYRLSPKRTSPFKSAGASVQSNTGSRVVCISGSNAGYTSSEIVWRVLATHSIRQFPLHFPSRASPCDIRFQMYSYSKLLCNFCSIHTIYRHGLGLHNTYKLWGRGLETHTEDGIPARLRARRSGVKIPARARFFSKTIQNNCKVNPLCGSLGMGLLFPGVKRMGRWSFTCI